MRQRTTLLIRIFTVITMAVTLGLPASPSSAAPSGMTTTNVSFIGSGGVVLHGTILAPASGTGPKPGIVMLEGAGNRGRQYLMPDAEAYARHGIVTLVYDKRTVGYSRLRRDYSILADDALAGLRLLHTRSEVDPDRVGLWALSEGAFVAPIAANRSIDVKYLISLRDECTDHMLIYNERHAQPWSANTWTTSTPTGRTKAGSSGHPTMTRPSSSRWTSPYGADDDSAG